MHELPATQAILDTALDTARAAGAARVTSVEVVIGALSSMLDDSVQFYFDVLSRSTPAAGAQLRFRRVAARAQCFSCDSSYDVMPPLRAQCERCGSQDLLVGGGREFFIESIEVDE